MIIITINNLILCQSTVIKTNGPIGGPSQTVPSFALMTH